MEKSIKRAWKVSSALMILLIAMGWLPTTVFANSVSDSFENKNKIASKSNVVVTGDRSNLPVVSSSSLTKRTPTTQVTCTRSKTKNGVFKAFVPVRRRISLKLPST